MTPDEYARLKVIVADALSRPDADRTAFVIAQCGPDIATRMEAESLLAAAVEAARLYEDPTLLIHGTEITPDLLDDIEEVTLPFLPLMSNILADGSAGPGPGTENEFGGSIRPGLPTDTEDDQFQRTERYAVRRRIGGGGMGIVYEVEDRTRRQIVALKTLRHRDGDHIYQLKREFRNLADVAHPNLVSLYDLVVDDEQCFFTMELVEGMTFVDYVRQRTPGNRIAARAREALPLLVAGIHELHRRGLQHRDIKPSNVLVTPAGRVVVLDFGLTSGASGPAEAGHYVQKKVREGREIVGTPAYLSPEQCLGGNVSTASDWYAVGATLYHALTGRVPFDGTIDEVVERKMTGDPPPPSALAPDIPPDLDVVCMALLHRDPALRMSGGEALDRLSGSGTEASTGGEPQVPVFVGRETSLGVLDAALADVTRGRSVSVFIYGPSGIGKSALAQTFLDRTRGAPPAFVLRSRCHEHESIPYKALDGIIDSITRQLSALPAPEVAQLLPPGTDVLARLFPVVRALGVEPDLEADIPDPILLRRQAFGAFRELLDRLGRRGPVVIDIDDFHWADADSLRWLTDLLRPPAPSSLLVLVSFRSEELDAKPFLRALVERVDIGDRRLLPLAPMPADEIARLIAALLDAHGAPHSAHPDDIVRDSGGNPFLVEAMTRDQALGPSTPRAQGRPELLSTGGAQPRGRASLDEMLTRRLNTLPAGSQAFLETLAICGRPVLPARIFEACGLHGDERRLVASLRAAHLVRNSRSEDRVEMYHDRIRETLASRMAPDDSRQIHDVMARVLVANEDDDPEALFEHYRAAGRIELAAGQAAAAAVKASAVLAFDLAATFYRQALDLQPDANQRAAWNADLARALENAGRPVEAAEAYLDAARDSRDTDTLEWRRKAAELLLVGGQIDRGLAVIDDVLQTLGLRLARGPRTAVASLALRRLQLRWRGLEFTERSETEIAPEDLLRIDASWSISAGLAMVDPIRAAAFNVRQLLRALDVGDPYRIARALALEAGFSVVGAGGARRSREFSRRASAFARQSGGPYLAALTSLWAGIAAFLTGRWKEATELCGRAVTTLRDECTGVMWELNMAHNFFLGGLLAQGELREVAGHLPGLIRLARERGNFYLELELSTRMILAWLASDTPDEAERRANDAIARWSQRGFQRQHFGHLLTVVQTALYRGEANEAWELIERHQRPLRRSLFLRVQHTRIESSNYRARSALAAAAAGHEPARMRAIATREVARMERENMPWSNPFARLLRAMLAHQEGNVAAAAKGLDEAIVGFESADMHLYVAVCRRRLSSLVGGDRGQALRRAADDWMAVQDIRNPASMTRLVAPGLPD